MIKHSQDFGIKVRNPIAHFEYLEVYKLFVGFVLFLQKKNSKLNKLTNYYKYYDQVNEEKIFAKDVEEEEKIAMMENLFG